MQKFNVLVVLFMVWNTPITIAQGNNEVLSPPTCEDVGSQNEGWYRAENGIIWYGKCSGCVPECREVGSPSEGWFAVCGETATRIEAGWCGRITSFSDVPPGHPDFAAVTFLQERRVAQGYPNGTYRPQQSINRAEFVKILMESRRGLSYLPTANCFPDVGNEWYSPHVCLAKHDGILEGYPDGTFRPESLINVAEAAKIIARTYRMALITSDDPRLTLYRTAEQNGLRGQENPYWWQVFIETLRDAKALPRGYSDPGFSLTRGGMAQIMYKLLKE
ncbi:S-layer homology domain-containing protein [Candidatus Peregrinibacteria bacterium]|nr:S-layer homology domain-containing protein [Candidatus Peregrinibacteria bacterium]